MYKRQVVAHASGEPKLLTNAMVENAKAFGYRDVEVVHMIAMGNAGYCTPEMSGHFRHNGLFLGGPTRAAVEELSLIHIYNYEVYDQPKYRYGLQSGFRGICVYKACG